MHETLNARSKTQIGNAAEHVACASLLLAGIHASITAHAAPYDIVADVGDGRVLRVEVKSKSSLTMADTEFQLAWSKNFALVDVVCAVAMPSGKHAFIPAAALTPNRVVAIRMDEMGLLGEMHHPFSAVACIANVVVGTPINGSLYYVDKALTLQRRAEAAAARKLSAERIAEPFSSVEHKKFRPLAGLLSEKWRARDV